MAQISAPSLPTEACSGCAACREACPRDCISMKPDKEGFLRPEVDASRCVGCKSCMRACPVLSPKPEREPLKVYAAYIEDEEIRAKSTSGGLFSHLARKTIEEGGVVFGVSFDDDWNTFFGFTETLEGLEPFVKSKYVPALPTEGAYYRKVREFLQSGRKVLFSGTPCQTAGLCQFLGKDYGNLITVSVLCHSAPSPMVWRNYLEAEKRRQAKRLKLDPGTLEITNLTFRDKIKGWKHGIALYFDLERDGEKVGTYYSRNSAYFKAFLYGLISRPCCYSCPFKSGRHSADISLGDFWEIGKVFPEMDDDKGISMVLVYTEKGEEALCLEGLRHRETTYDAVRSFNKVEKQSPHHKNRDKVFQRLEKSSDYVRTLHNSRLSPYKRVRFRVRVLLGMAERE